MGLLVNVISLRRLLRSDRSRSNVRWRYVGGLRVYQLLGVFVAKHLPGRRHESLLRQGEDRAGRGEAAQDVLAERGQRYCSLGSDRA